MVCLHQYWANTQVRAGRLAHSIHHTQPCCDINNMHWYKKRYNSSSALMWKLHSRHTPAAASLGLQGRASMAEKRQEASSVASASSTFHCVISRSTSELKSGQRQCRGGQADVKRRMHTCSGWAEAITTR